MKKYFFIICTAVLIAACGSNSSENNSGDTSATTDTKNSESDITSNPDYSKGLALVAQSDCLTCHKVDEKVTGPAYKDVAGKYEDNDANVKMLAAKIIKGGSGNWGDAVMTPHPDLAEADAEQMVKYILLLKNQ